MTRVLHTIWICIVKSIMYANKIRKMINIELGNEIKKHVFPSFITVIRARLSIIYCLGGRRIFGKGGGSHGFKLEQRGISRRQKSKNCLMRIRKIVLWHNQYPPTPQAINNYWSFTVLSVLFYLPSALLTKITSRQTLLSWNVITFGDITGKTHLRSACHG